MLPRGSAECHLDGSPHSRSCCWRRAAQIPSRTRSGPTTMHDPLPLLSPSDFPPLRRAALETVQVNLGYRCNLSCVHCHVSAGPNRTEEMDGETADQVLRYLELSSANTLDLTGGAPELNAHFRAMVRRARGAAAAGDRPVQSHDPRGARPRRPRGVSRFAPGPDCRFAPMLRGRERLEAAWRRRVRCQHPCHPAPE